MVNESDVAAAYQAAVEASDAAGAAHQAAVDKHGPKPDADLPESLAAQELEREADAAWDAYSDAHVDFWHPEQTADGEAYLEALDHELGPDPGAETEAEAG